MTEYNVKRTDVQKYFNWKIVLVVFSTLTILALILLIKMKSYFSSKVNSELFDKYYSLFVAILFLNMCLSTYTISLYYYRISKPGMKGQTGKYGRLGDDGKSSTCDLYTPKQKRFKLEKEVKLDKYNVDINAVRNATLDLNRRRVDPKWFNIVTNDKNSIHYSNTAQSPSKHILGNKFSKCLDDNKCTTNNGNGSTGIGVVEGVYNKNQDIIPERLSTKPFNGGIFNYELNDNKTRGKLNSLQFTYDKNQPMKKKKINMGLVGERLGNQNNVGKGGEFTCPPHSSIYKIETLHDVDSRDGTGNLVGMKFHCRDIKTGNHVKILNSSNNLVDEIHFGVEPTPKNTHYKYGKVECGNFQRCKKVSGRKKCEGRPGFLSNYTSITDPKGIVALKFNKCSYLEPNPIKDNVD
jgi:hypothetical protein